MKTITTFLTMFILLGTAKADLITGFFLVNDSETELREVLPLRVEYTTTSRSAHSDQFPNEIREFVFWGEDSVNFAIGTGNVDEPLTVGETYPSNPLWNLYTPNPDGSNGLWFHDGFVGPQTGVEIQIGSFTVLDLEFDDFGEIASIAVDFTQINENSTTTSGAMRYNSTVAFDAAVPEPGTASLMILAFVVFVGRMRIR